jgi:hypothetical protein
MNIDLKIGAQVMLVTVSTALVSVTATMADTPHCAEHQSEFRIMACRHKGADVLS